MTGFRILCVALFAIILTYTMVVTAHHGANLMPIFFGDIAQMGWPGQFNMDFSSFLTLSAVWLAWRHHFSATGFVLAIAGFLLGGLFLSAYLFVVSLKAPDIQTVLVGPGRAARG